MEENDFLDEDNEQPRNLKRSSPKDSVFPSPLAKRSELASSSPVVPSSLVGGSTETEPFIFSPNLESPSSLSSSRFRCSVGDNIPVASSGSTKYDVGISTEDITMASLTSLDRDMLSNLNPEDQEEINSDSPIKLLSDEIITFDTGQYFDDNGNGNVTNIPDYSKVHNKSDLATSETKEVPTSALSFGKETYLSPDVEDNSWTEVENFTSKRLMPKRQDSLEVQNSDMSESVDMSTSDVFDEESGSLSTGGAKSLLSGDENIVISDPYVDVEYKYELSHGGSSFSSISSFQEEGAAVKKKKKKRRTKSKEQDEEERPETPMSLRPNYFIGIQVSNPEIHKAVVKVQQSIVEACPEISKALIDVATLHLTLLVAHISDEEAMHSACAALDKCCEMLEKTLLKEPIRLTFSGLSHFSHQTLYVKVVEDDNFQKLIKVGEVIKKVFFEHDIHLPDVKDFYPHLTIVKLSKAPRGKKRMRRFDTSIFESYKDLDFGTQSVTSLQLLSMHKPKTESRYYYTARESVLDVIPCEDEDHSQCCFPRLPDISSLSVPAIPSVDVIKSVDADYNKESEDNITQLKQLNETTPPTDIGLQMLDMSSPKQKSQSPESKEYSLLSDIQEDFDKLLKSTVMTPEILPELAVVNDSENLINLDIITENEALPTKTNVDLQFLNEPLPEDIVNNQSSISSENYFSSPNSSTSRNNVSDEWKHNYVASKELENLLVDEPRTTSDENDSVEEVPDSSKPSDRSNELILHILLGAVCVVLVAVGVKYLRK